MTRGAHPLQHGHADAKCRRPRETHLFLPLACIIPDYGTRGAVEFWGFPGVWLRRRPGAGLQSNTATLTPRPHVAPASPPTGRFRVRWALRQESEWRSGAKPCLWTRSTPTEMVEHRASGTGMARSKRPSRGGPSASPRTSSGTTIRTTVTETQNGVQTLVPLYTFMLGNNLDNQSTPGQHGRSSTLGNWKNWGKFLYFLRNQGRISVLGI